MISACGERSATSAEETAEEMAAASSSDDTASFSATGSASWRTDEQDSSFSASFSSLILLEPSASIHNSSRAHLKSFLAAGRRRDLAGERGEGRRFSRARDQEEKGERVLLERARGRERERE
jgi:hypothetical protein